VLAAVPPPRAAAVATRARKTKPATPRRRGGVHPLLGLLAAAAGVGLAVMGKEHIATGATAARGFVAASVEATRRMRAAAAAAEREAEDEPAMLHVPAKPKASAAPRAAEAAAAPPMPVTEWQLRPAQARQRSAPPPSEAPEAWRAGASAGGVREVRWQPHVSLGRG